MCVRVSIHLAGSLGVSLTYESQTDQETDALPDLLEGVTADESGAEPSADLGSAGYEVLDFRSYFFQEEVGGFRIIAFSEVLFQV